VADLLVTDPPYGVSVDHRWRTGVTRPLGKAREGVVANDDRADWREAWDLTDAPVAYVWHGGVHAAAVYDSLTASGFEIRYQIIWVKTVAALSRGAYHWQHEPCWYAVRKGAKSAWRGDRKQTTVWEVAPPNQIMGGSDEERTVHPTQKPVELFERPIRNHTARGALVYEPFAGSGSAVIAAENLNRRCYALEIDPAYCDVIVDRWERHTGGKAKLER
jgi:DNA modification methylase